MNISEVELKAKSIGKGIFVFVGWGTLVSQLFLYNCPQSVCSQQAPWLTGAVSDVFGGCIALLLGRWTYDMIPIGEIMNKFRKQGEHNDRQS